jgi:hypothetical protein
LPYVGLGRLIELRAELRTFSFSCPFGLEELLANLGLAFEHEVVVPGPVAIKLRPQFGIGDLEMADSLFALLFKTLEIRAREAGQDARLAVGSARTLPTPVRFDRKTVCALAVCRAEFARQANSGLGSECGALLRVCLKDKTFMASWQLALRWVCLSCPFVSIRYS